MRRAPPWHDARPVVFIMLHRCYRCWLRSTGPILLMLARHSAYVRCGSTAPVPERLCGVLCVCGFSVVGFCDHMACCKLMQYCAACHCTVQCHVSGVRHCCQTKLWCMSPAVSLTSLSRSTFCRMLSLLVWHGQHIGTCLRHCLPCMLAMFPWVCRHCVVVQGGLQASCSVPLRLHWQCLLDLGCWRQPSQLGRHA